MIGIDIVHVGRIERLCGRYDQRFLRKVFTEEEIAYATKKRRRFECLAGMFALKEAFMKAKTRRIPFREIEIRHRHGKPYISFKGRTFFQVSVSHERDMAAAVVVVGEKG